MRQFGWLAFGVFLAVLCCAPTAASAKKASSKHQARTAVGGGVQKTRFFFETFVHHKPAERNEFESESAYRSRISRQAWDPSKVVFLDVFPTLFQNGHVYDIKSQRLSILAGGTDLLDRDSILPMYAGFRNGQPRTILEVFDHKGDYIGENAFGRRTLVRKNYLHRYVLNFANLKCCPADAMDRGRDRFCITIVEPPGEAKRLSRNAQIVLEVRLPGYHRSGTVCTGGHDPTISEPSDTEEYTWQIDAELVAVLLRDNSTGKVIASRYVDCARALAERAAEESGVSAGTASIRGRIRYGDGKGLLPDSGAGVWLFTGHLSLPPGDGRAHAVMDVVHVAMSSSGSDTTLWSCQHVETDADGGYSIGNVSPGMYTVAIQSAHLKGGNLRDSEGNWCWKHIAVERNQALDLSWDVLSDPSGSVQSPVPRGVRP